jgi:2-keto-4-pentenoate hydratase/2-oxohepta-3-ene-1,7-dioic acid hydratase in catechol pathway
MRICTFRRDHEDRLSPGLVLDDAVVDLTRVALSFESTQRDGAGRIGSEAGIPQLISAEASELLHQIHEAAVQGEAAEFGGRPLKNFPLEAIKLGPPVPKPAKIVAAGRNYAAHTEEAKIIWEERGVTPKPPTYPTGFFKMPSAVIGPYDDVPYPETNEMDYEVELAVIIGKYALNVDPETALTYVAGYTVMNDISARDIQFSEMENVGIVVGKNFEGFAPMGPWLVTTEEISDPQSLTIKLSVNGENRQDSSTSKMTFSVAECVSYFSKMGLRPGDVVMTGSPEGIATVKRPDPGPFYLKPGDMVEAEIGGIGSLQNRIIGTEVR